MGCLRHKKRLKDNNINYLFRIFLLLEIYTSITKVTAIYRKRKIEGRNIDKALDCGMLRGPNGN